MANDRQDWARGHNVKRKMDDVQARMSAETDAQLLNDVEGYKRDNIYRTPPQDRGGVDDWASDTDRANIQNYEQAIRSAYPTPEWAGEMGGPSSHRGSLYTDPSGTETDMLDDEGYFAAMRAMADKDQLGPVGVGQEQDRIAALNQRARDEYLEGENLLLTDKVREDMLAPERAVKLRDNDFVEPPEEDPRLLEQRRRRIGSTGQF